MTEQQQTDVIVVGAGLAGLVATAELAAAGRRVILVDQENQLGGQAWWSFGGLFLVNTPEQRRLGVRDSAERAWQDWLGTAGFDRPEDHWPRQWAEAYVHFAAGENRSWLHQKGHRIFPVVGWAERGGDDASGPGNSVPRFHITWGTGPGIVEPFEREVQEAVAQGRVTVALRHRVQELILQDGVVTGASGTVLEPTTAGRGEATSREAVGDFEFSASAVVVTSGGIGGNSDLVREAWPKRLGTPPKHMIAGVPQHVDGSGIQLTQRAGGRVVNADRMWHYVEGIKNHTPVWKDHGIRILPGPSSLWLDATGKRLPAPLFPGFDTLGSLEYLRKTGHDHSWFILNARIIEKEFALSGSEQNPDLTGRSVKEVLRRARPGPTAPVQSFIDRGEDFVQATTLEELVSRMNALEPQGPLLDIGKISAVVQARDRDVVNSFGKDAQIAAIRSARGFVGDKLMRSVAPHQLLDPKAGPLIAVRLHVITRKTLGGLETDLDGRVLAEGGAPIPGLFAAGEASGFGGGGMHGYRSLEGTFLGGCLFSGRAAGRAAAAALP